HWHFYAILELIGTRGFKPDPQWIARRLGLSLTETQASITTLTDLGLLEIGKGTRPVWKDRHERMTTIQSPFTAVPLRRLQRQILEKAIAAMEEIPMDQRDQSSLTLGFKPSAVPQAKVLIKKFRRQLGQLAKTHGHPTEVYHLSVSLYPVSRRVP
ncbi:MAG: DUF4423 domain-containing protein, partial [Deltaproteobacteria bacterium]|nr:DUF4423 domain-containing protein [Deltaproteobacteria bacterium]